MSTHAIVAVRGKDYFLYLRGHRVTLMVNANARLKFENGAEFTSSPLNIGEADAAAVVFCPNVPAVTLVFKDGDAYAIRALFINDAFNAVREISSPQTAIPALKPEPGRRAPANPARLFSPDLVEQRQALTTVELLFLSDSVAVAAQRLPVRTDLTVYLRIGDQFAAATSIRKHNMYFATTVRSDGRDLLLAYQFEGVQKVLEGEKKSNNRQYSFYAYDVQQLAAGSQEPLATQGAGVDQKVSTGPYYVRFVSFDAGNFFFFAGTGSSMYAYGPNGRFTGADLKGIVTDCCNNVCVHQSVGRAGNQLFQDKMVVFKGDRAFVFLAPPGYDERTWYLAEHNGRVCACSRHDSALVVDESGWVPDEAVAGKHMKRAAIAPVLLAARKEVRRGEPPGPQFNLVAALLPGAAAAASGEEEWDPSPLPLPEPSILSTVKKALDAYHLEASQTASSSQWSDGSGWAGDLFRN